MRDPLNQCDMAIVLSESQINRQFFEMLKTRIINPEFRVTLQIQILSFTVDISFQANIHEVVLVVTEAAPDQPLFIMSFDEMTVSSGPDSQVVPKGLTYAFRVNMNELSQKYNKDLSIVTPQAKHALDAAVSDASQASGIDTSEFIIQSLVLDFENSDIFKYRPKASNLKPLKKLKPPITLSILQTAIAEHFQKLVGTNNPYILGYAIKTPFVQNTNALFKPTECYVSTSYRTNVSLSAFNFLMMIDNNVIKNGLRAGILDQGWLTSPTSEVDGTLVIRYLSFRKAVIKPIVDLIGESLGDLVKTLISSGLDAARNTQNDGIFDPGSYNHIQTVALPTKGQLSAKGDYNWSAEGTPWNIIVDSNAILNQDNSDRFAPSLGGGSGLTTYCYTYYETDSITPVISIKNSDNGIELDLAIRVVGSQVLKEKTASTHCFPETIESSGYFQNYGRQGTHVSSISLSIESSLDGSIATKANYQKGNFVQKKADFKGKASPLFSETNINCLHKSLQNLSESLSEAIQKNLVQIYSKKTVFPLSNISTYKNLRLKFPPDSYRGADNVVVTDISY